MSRYNLFFWLLFFLPSLVIAQPIDPDLDEQTLSFSNPDLSISSGNTVDLSTLIPASASAVEGTDLGTLVDGQMCVYDSAATEIDCNVAAVSDTNANTQCFGTTTYLDGEGNCDDISSVYAASSHNHAASDVNSGTFADARISESSVTQHEAAIDAGSMEGTDFGTLSNGKFCMYDSTGTEIDCNTSKTGSGSVLVSGLAGNAGTVPVWDSQGNLEQNATGIDSLVVDTEIDTEGELELFLTDTAKIYTSNDSDFVTQNEIADNAIQEEHLKAVDTAADEECLTYESTTGDFEWQSCGGGSIDISDGTNLAVSSPITLTDDTVGLDYSTNNTWTGDNVFSKNLEIGSSGTSSDYESFLIKHTADSGGGYFVQRTSGGSGNIFVALSAWENAASTKQLFYGGGGWNAHDANEHRFYTDPNKPTTGNNGGILRLYIDETGHAKFTNTVEIGNSGVANDWAGLTIKHTATSGGGYMIEKDGGLGAFVGLAGFDFNGTTLLSFGGGGWNARDANTLTFWTDPTTSNTDQNEGVRRGTLTKEGAWNFGNSQDTDAQVVIEADQDWPSLRIQAEASQTSDIFIVEDSSGNDYASINSAGVLELQSTTCLDVDSDRLYHDTDCDGTKDSGENYIDNKPIVTYMCTDVTGWAADQYVSCANGQTNSGTESTAVKQAKAMGDMTLKELHCHVETAPGTGDKWDIYVRDDGASVGSACTISESNTTCTVTGMSVSVADDSSINTFWDEVGTNANSGDSGCMIVFEKDSL